MKKEINSYRRGKCHKESSIAKPNIKRCGNKEKEKPHLQLSSKDVLIQESPNAMYLPNLNCSILTMRYPVKKFHILMPDVDKRQAKCQYYLMNITIHLRAPKFNGHIFNYRTAQFWSPQIDDQDHQFPLLLFEALIHFRPSNSILPCALHALT